MADHFALEVVTPEKVLVAAPAVSISLRTSGGSLAIMPGHAPFVGDVIAGAVNVDREDAEPIRLAVHGGYVQVETGRGVADGVAGVGDGPIAGVSTRVTLIVGVAELAEDIDVARAETAKADATARLEQLRSAGARSDAAEDSRAEQERAMAEADLARADLRLAVTGVNGS